MKSICDTSFTISLNSFKVMVGRLEKKKQELCRNKKREQVEILFSEPFCSKSFSPSPNEDGALAQEKSKTEELTAKLSKLSVRNVNKRIKRRDDKIAKSQGHIKEMEDDKKVQDKRIHKLEHQLHTAHASVLHQRLSRSNKKVEATSLENTDVNSQLCEMETEFSSKIAKLQEKIEVLITEVELARHERDILSERLDDIQVGTIRTKEGQKFTDSVHQCCIELLSMNVATYQVEPVIRSVLQNIATIEVSALPKASSLSGMLVEMKCLAYQQISDELDHQENITLHSDGTSKFGEHYGSYRLSTEKSVYSLGLCEMLTGSAELTLHTFKQIINDLDLVARKSGDVVVSKIKNTMSDRHIVQKNFNTLLEEYRLGVLPSIIEDWNQLSTAEQDQLSHLNNFFCGMHLLVGMADTTSSTLLQWENTHFEAPIGAATIIAASKSESGIVRLVRTTCKAMCRHGSEQSGVYQPFTTFMT